MVSFLGCVCTDCCDYVAISGAEAVLSTSMAIFVKTNITSNNRPVYQNSDGHSLYYDSGLGIQSGWILSHNGVGLTSVEEALCPSDVQSWVLWTSDGSAAGCTPENPAGCIRSHSGATSGCTTPTTGASTTASSLSCMVAQLL